MSRPPDPREERFRPLSQFLALAVVAVAVLGAVALAFGGTLGTTAAVAMVLLLVGTPLLRVLWFVVRWFRRGDPRFALVGVVVLAVPVAALVLSR